AWFVGFTSDYVCGVWLGNDNNTPMKHVTGGTLPSRIFKTFMADAERGLPVQPLTSIRLAPPPPPQISLGETSVGPQAAAAPRTQKPSTFEQILDSLFGG